MSKLTNLVNERISDLHRYRVEKIDDKLFSLNDYIEFYKVKTAKKIELEKQKNKRRNLDTYIKKQEELLKKNEVKTVKQIESLKSKRKEIKIKLAKYSDELNIPTLDDDVILQVDNLSMHFGGLKAVDNLSFKVKKGEIFGLIGPNGAGKTTVFNCITQFYNPTFGNIHYIDKTGETISLNKVNVHNIIKKGIVRTFQNVELVWELTVLENLLVAAHTLFQTNIVTQTLRTRRLKNEEEIMTTKAINILTSLGLQNYALAYPIGLPYGILKKIELARTLMCNPKLIILDEPAAGLNDQETTDLADTIKIIQKEYDATIFLVEHDMELVMKICDTICAISFGKKLAIGTASEIQNNKLVQEAYLGGE